MDKIIARIIKLGKRNCLTIALVCINISVFATYGFGNVDAITLIGLGANFAPFSLDNEPQRLITSLFLHGNLIHLIANMYSLIVLGWQLEGRLGSRKFIEAYILSGLAGGIASLNFNLFVTSVGASGAIFGLYGFLLVESIRDRNNNRIVILLNFVIYLLVVTLLGIKYNFDNAAHFGGVGVGIIMGVLDKGLYSKWINGAVMLVLLAAFLATPRYPVSYFKNYNDYVAADKRIVQFYNAALSDQDLFDSLSQVKDLPEKVIAGFRKIDYVPTELTIDTLTIMGYLGLRNGQIDFFLKGLSNESFIYLDSIQYLGSQFDRYSQIKYPLYLGRDQPETKAIESESLEFTKQNYDDNWFETDGDLFTYYRLGQKDSLGDWQGRVEDYYQSGAIQMKGNYRRGLKEGIFIYYSPDSTYESAGRYHTDRRTGKWESYDNGNLVSETRNEDGHSYLINLWDDTGQLIISNGNGKINEHYPDGTIKYKRTIKNGLRDGFTESYNEDGTLEYKEFHKKGIMVSGVSYSQDGTNTYDGSTYIPYPQGGFDAFYEYLSKENKLESDTIETFVIMRFDVHYTGKIYDFRFLKRYRKEYDEYAKSLLMNGPKWNPAKSHGLTEMSAYAEVTIRF